MNLKEKLVISVPFVIPNFGALLQALHNQNFAKFLHNFKAIYMCIKSVTMLFNNKNENFPFLRLKNRYKR